MFDYIHFALTVPLVHHFTEKYIGPDKSDELDKVYIQGILDHIKKMHGIDLDYEKPLAFIKKRAEVYTHLTPYEHIISTILNDGDVEDGLYFPEIREYMQGINPALTEEEYQSAFNFWQNYQLHLKARQHIKVLSDVLSIENVKLRDGDYESWGCIGFKDNPGNTDAVNEIIVKVNQYTERLGFTPWVNPLVKYLSLPSGRFVGTQDGVNVDFFLSTNIGTIYPYGKPTIKSKVSNHLKSV